MTLDEICSSFDEFDELEPWQHKMNREWLQDVYDTLKMGGTWIHPEVGDIYTKTEEGFDLVPVIVEQ